jgi:hypothetical protein
VMSWIRKRFRFGTCGMKESCLSSASPYGMFVSGDRQLARESSGEAGQKKSFLTPLTNGRRCGILGGWHGNGAEQANAD